MATYSIGTPPTDATKLADLTSVLNSLPDNTSKLIHPVDVRNSIYTVWENSIFKPTRVSGFEYIGIDQDNFQEKIFFGKKKVAGQYIMSPDSLNGGDTADIYFYNTKSEPANDYSTTIAFLAGTGSFFNGGQLNVPYIKIQDVFDTYGNSSLDFNLINPSGSTYAQGNINIEAGDNGVVTINTLQFPTVSDYLSGTISNGYVLTYYKVGSQPIAQWVQLGTQSVIDTVYSSGTVSITGSPVIINGSNYNITDTNPTPIQIGGIAAGTTFNNVPVSDIVHQILYPYITPKVSLSMSSNYVEEGSTLPTLNYSITKNATYSINAPTLTSSVTLTFTPIAPSNITSNGITSGTSSVTKIYPLGTQSYSIQNFTMNVTDDYPSSVTASVSFDVVIPWYYGTSFNSLTGSNVYNIFGTSSNPPLGYLKPLLTAPVLSSSSSYNKTLFISGQIIYIYFAYPADFPDLLNIKDPNGWDQISSFTQYIVTGINSPGGGNGVWNGKSYKVYISNNLTTAGGAPSYGGDFQFNFA
jgi:hypothetical protein